MCTPFSNGLVRNGRTWHIGIWVFFFLFFLFSLWEPWRIFTGRILLSIGEISIPFLFFSHNRCCSKGKKNRTIRAWSRHCNNVKIIQTQWDTEYLCLVVDLVLRLWLAGVWVVAEEKQHDMIHYFVRRYFWDERFVTRTIELRRALSECVWNTHRTSSRYSAISVVHQTQRKRKQYVPETFLV